MVRAAGLRGLVPLVDELGGDGAALLAQFAVPPEALDSDDALIPTVTAGHIIGVAAAVVHRPDFGLLLAERQDVGVLGPLAIAVEHSATLGAAIDCITRFMFIHSPALSLRRIPDPEGHDGTVGVTFEGTEGRAMPPQVADLGLGLMHRMIAMLGGGSYPLRSVHLPHPPLAPLSRYVDFFGADVRFDRPAAVLRVPAHLMDTSLPGRNDILRKITLDYLASHFDEPGQPVGARVRTILLQSLGSSVVSVERIASVLQLHPRTLQRLLASEGSTYAAILDGVRRESAHTLITRSDLPFSEITAMVGLTEQSALTRAVRRWFGETPRRLRAVARDGASRGKSAFLP